MSCVFLLIANLVTMACNLFVVVFVSAVIVTITAMDNYCSIDNYLNSGPHMQLTKEANFEEFAIVGMFKALHCCAKGYKAIEWYKDDTQYPWPASKSKLILYPEVANQTIYVQSVREEDAGNYTCVLRNDTTVIRHTIQLKVYEKVPDAPKITYISEDKEIAVGQELRLFCEAFAGRVDLPDARNEAVWQRANYNGSIDNDTRIIQKKSTREEHQTFGIYLIINEVRKQDYGVYTCKVSNPGTYINKNVRVTEKIEVLYADPNPIPVTKLVLVISCMSCMVVVLLILNYKYGLALRVRFKDSFGPLEEANGKTSDVMIVYSEKDSDLALGVLLPTLESRYNYKCASRELVPTVTTWYTDLKGPSQNSKRLVAILSPSALNDNWDNDSVLQALKQLQSVGPPLCVITLKELPTKQAEVKNAQGETLTSLSRTLNVVPWDRDNDDKFWLSLRLMLPPNRQIPQNQTQNTSRLTSDSQESLDNLV